MAGKLVLLLTVCAALGGTILAGEASAAVPAWTTYRHDAARSGFDPDSTIPIAPSSAWQTPASGAGALDAPMYAQPLVYGSRVYAATENNTIYSLDAATGAVIWKAHVATPESSGTAPCGDIAPTIGITGTPVIDPATNRIYAVAAVASGGSVTHQLFAVDLSTGSVVPGFPVSADPPGDNPVDVLQRPALTLQGNRVVVGYGGNDGDCASYHGWLVSVPTAGGARTSFEADPSAGNHGGAIWGSGTGPALDAGGNVWVATGNGFSGSAFDFGESVVHLGPSMSLVSPGSYWAPSNWKALDNTDADIGSSEPVLLPSNLILQSGKDGNAYLINGGSPGGISSPLSTAPVCPGAGSFGGSVYLASSTTIYLACMSGLKALTLNPATRTLALDTSFAAPGNANGPPIIAGGLVWVTAWGSGKLYGLDPTSGQVRFQALAGMEHFATPSAGGGRLFLAAKSQVLALRIGTAPPSPGGGAPPGGGKHGGPAGAPRIFETRLVPAVVRRARRGTTLRVRLSESGRVNVSISRLMGGRRVHGRCVAGVRHGRRCTLRRLRARRGFTAAAGSRRLRLVLRGLRPGSYLVTIVLTAQGRRSRPVTLRLRITA